MKICILTRTPGRYTENKIFEEAKAAGHDAFFVRPSDCMIVFENNGAKIIDANGEKLSADAVIPRIQNTLSEYDRAVLRQLESDGTYILIGSLAIGRSFDIVRTLQILNKNGICMPHTVVGRSQSIPDSTLDKIDFPVAIRSTSSSSNIVMASSQNTTKSLIRAFSADGSGSIIQEIPRATGGRRITAILLGGHVIASIRNVDGSFSPLRLKTHEEKTLEKIAKSLNLRFCSIESVFYDETEYIILDINAMPKIETVEKISGRNIAERLIKYIELNAKRQHRDRVGT